MQKSDAYIKTVFNRLSDPVLICPLNFGKTLGNFILVNNTSTKVLGYSFGEFSELNILSLSFDKNEAVIVNVIEQLLTNNEAIFDFIFLTKSGSPLKCEINAALTELNNQQVIIFSARETSCREKMETQIIQTSEQLRNLSLHIQSIREEERTSIAREIHDELGQMLTALKIQISLLSKKLPTDQTEIKDKFEKLSENIGLSVETVRKITAKLRPGILDELGLIAAIEWQAKEFSATTGIICSLDISVEEVKFNPEKTTAIFRIFQEALTNIARHANALRVKISFTEYKNSNILEITDYGKGITKNQVNNPKSLGILGMKERAMLFGGNLVIKSLMGNGTVVRLEIPSEEDEIQK